MKKAKPSQKALLRGILLRNKRAILAFNDAGVHLRATLCVAHDIPSGKVTYDAQPVISFQMRSEKARRNLMFQILDFIINADPKMKESFEQFMSQKGGGK